MQKSYKPLLVLLISNLTFCLYAKEEKVTPQNREPASGSEILVSSSMAENKDKYKFVPYQVVSFKVDDHTCVVSYVAGAVGVGSTSVGTSTFCFPTKK